MSRMPPTARSKSPVLRIPGLLPGVMLPPSSTVTAPVVPVPPTVASALMVMGLLPRLPSTKTVPSSRIICPVNPELSPVRFKEPSPLKTIVPEPVREPLNVVSASPLMVKVLSPTFRLPSPLKSPISVSSLRSTVAAGAMKISVSASTAPGSRSTSPSRTKLSRVRLRM
ncbi:hypothetical protein CWATWH0005_1074 [Crocosphaera watsonii WH 0005]|uniref:Uncharacterized protein n=1 Tax=Crocosphaera watsonii WH 0005 TaxID=423472 RepID=T2IQH5_CROWT|nr:hypothetical protein CWATWH0005_1074 [Crocosphaera watsonii WH 0005]